MNRHEKKKHGKKLNMLEPGLFLLKIVGALALGGIALRAFGQKQVAWFLWGAAGLLVLVLCILLVIERRQDARLYRAAKEKDPDIK